MNRNHIIACLLFFSCNMPAQFWNDMHSVSFRLEDSTGTFIADAEVKLNDVRMNFNADCNLFADKKCYRIEQKKDSVKFLPRNKVIIKAPGYLEFNDSVTYGAPVVLLKPGDNYYFSKTKMPCKVMPDHFFATFEDELTRDEFKKLVKDNHGKIIKSYSYCGFFAEDIGPFILVFKLKRDSALTKELLQKIYLRGEVGPLISGPEISGINGFSGITNAFTINFYPLKKNKAEQFLEELKQSGNLKDYDFDSRSNTIHIQLEKWFQCLSGKENMVPLIENLLDKGLFYDPVMELMIYNCPG